LGEYLPGSVSERLRELREAHGYTTKSKLIEASGIDRSKYNRVENGTTQSISGDLLVQLSEFYGVTTDYILGLSDIPERTYYDIEKLGFSVEASKNILSGKVDARVLNELLLNENFGKTTRMMATFFTGYVAQAIANRNALLDFSYGLIEEGQREGLVPKDKEISELQQGMKSSHMAPYQYEMDKIRNSFGKAVKEIKEKVVEEVKSQQILSYDTIGALKENLGDYAGLLNKTDEEKMERIIKGMQKTVEEVPGVSDKGREEMSAIIEQVAPKLMELWSS